MNCLILTGVQNDNIAWNETTDLEFRQNKNKILSNLDKITKCVVENNDSKKWIVVLLMDIHATGPYCRINTWGSNLHTTSNIPYSFSTTKYPNISFFCIYQENGVQNQNAIYNIIKKFKECECAYIVGLKTKNSDSLSYIHEIVIKTGIQQILILDLMQDYTNLFLKDSC